MDQMTMGKPWVLYSFILCSLALVPTLGAPSSPDVRNGCMQRVLHKMVPWHQRNQVTNGTFNILNLERPIYNKNFKNPCWYEETKDGNQLQCLPYFFVAGWPKCGTTDLWVRIGQHPDVNTEGLRKEQHWWTFRRYKSQRRSSIDYYISLFRDTAKVIKQHSIEKDGKEFHPMITGEASPDTLWKMKFFQNILQNCPSDVEPTVVTAHMIKHLIPSAKIIVTLRNPVEHLFSMYLYFGKERKSPEAFHEICLKEISKWKNCIKEKTPRQCAYDMKEERQKRFRSTIYSVFLKDWLSVFPRDQIYVSQLEEYSKNEFKAMNNIFKFLDLDELKTPAVMKKIPVQNARHKNTRVTMLEKTRHLLEDFYRPYKQELSQLLKDDKWLYN